VRRPDAAGRGVARIDKERKRSDSLFVAEGKSPPVHYLLPVGAPSIRGLKHWRTETPSRVSRMPRDKPAAFYFLNKVLKAIL